MDPGTPLLRAVFLRRFRLTRLLLEGGTQVNECDSRGHTPLMLACSTRHADGQSVSRAKMVQFLLEKGADPNVQDEEGLSALMHACQAGAGPEVVSLLLDRGADVSLQDGSGTSALVHAAAAGDWKVLQLLLDTCKVQGKEVIIITTDQLPCGVLQGWADFGGPLSDQRDAVAAATPASPSEVQLLTSPESTVAFSFREGTSSPPVGPAGPGTRQQPLGRLNTEPLLKIPAPGQLQTPHQTSSPEHMKTQNGPSKSDQDRSWRERLGPKISLAGLLSSHSASHPDLHSDQLRKFALLPPAGKGPLQGLTSSSLHSIIQNRRLGRDIYSSDPQLAVNSQDRSEDFLLDLRRRAQLRCSSTFGSRESLLGSCQTRGVLPERRGSGTFLLDSQSRPRTLPPLHRNMLLLGSGTDHAEKGKRTPVPVAPPGRPSTSARSLLLRRHSVQTDRIKTSA